jgi:hypothetical protein
MNANASKPKGTFAKLMSSQPAVPRPQEANETAFKLIPQPVNQSTDKSTNQSVDQSTGRSISQPTNSSNGIVDRPKAFYITVRLDRKLDEAVRYFQDVHGIKKADRSTVVNAILDNEENWKEKSLDQLVDRLISQLTSRLTSK